MENPDSQARPWYKKKRYVLPLALAAVFTTAGAFGDSPAPVAPVQNVVPVETVAKPVIEAIQAEAPQPAAVRNANLSNDNYYTNVDGNEVHSPAYSESGCAAAGATAECRDGTCSFSQNRSGTCSHHGGVAEWL